MVTRPRCLGMTAAVLFAAVIAVTVAAPVHAVQHLIRPSDDWQSLGSRIRPGDEIILMPGDHVGAAFDKLIGTLQRPITIRGADPARPSTIYADREGIRVTVGHHLIIKDLIITGAKVNGIHISGGDPAELETGKPVRGNVIIRDVTINRTGPRGLRHGIVLRNLMNVRVEHCRFEGWGGAAIELVSCEQITIAHSVFKGLDDHSQTAGIRVRGCSESIDVEECRFDDPGEIAVCMGAASRIEELPPTLLKGASNGSLAEAARVNVQRTLFIDCAVPFGLVNASDCTIRNNTIIRPRIAVLTLSSEQADPRFTHGRNGVFGRNVIVWEQGGLQKCATYSKQHDWTRFVFDANLWWSPESAEQRSALVELPGKQILPQILDVDPRLDSKFKPTTAEARDFGF